jgi:sugar lactone lactonase YvrE
MLLGACALACVYQKLSVGTLQGGAGAAGSAGTGASGNASGNAGTSAGGSNGGAASSGLSAGQAGEAGADAGTTPLTELSLLAGQLGGCGTADGYRATARFESNAPVAYSSGRLYSTGSLGMRVVDVSNGTVSTILASADAARTLALAAGPNQQGLVSMRADQTVRAFDPTTNTETLIAGAAMMAGSVDATGGAARFNFSTVSAGITADAFGNIYLSDAGNFTIRKIDTSGKVSTLAGTLGTPGSSDAPAAFAAPAGVAVIGTYLYVADTDNRTIRRVDTSTGAVTTIAGTTGVPGTGDGDGTTALFASPTALLALNGTLYVLDNGVRLRAIDLSGASAQVTTVAGATGTLDDPSGPVANLIFSSDGSLTADGGFKIFWNDRCTIRSFDISTGNVATVAGTRAAPGDADGAASGASFDAPSGVAADDAGQLFVADSRNSTIRAVDVEQDLVSTLAGSKGSLNDMDGQGSAAQFGLLLKGEYAASGVVTDLKGDVFVVDSFAQTIRKIVVSSADVTTLAGSNRQIGTTNATGSNARFAHPAGMAMSGGKLFIVDTGPGLIRELDPITQLVSTVAGGAGSDGGAPAFDFSCTEGLAGLVGIAADSSGNLYVSDCGHHVIRKIVIQSGAISTLAGSFGDAGNDDGAGDQARFQTPLGLAFDGQGNLYVADPAAATIRKIELTTATVSTVAGRPGVHGVALGPLPASLNLPNGIAIMPDGGLVISDVGENALLRLR